MRGGTIGVIVTALTNGTRADRRAAVHVAVRAHTLRVGSRTAVRRHERYHAGGCQTPTGKSGARAFAISQPEIEEQTL